MSVRINFKSVCPFLEYYWCSSCWCFITKNLMRVSQVLLKFWERQFSSGLPKYDGCVTLHETPVLIASWKALSIPSQLTLLKQEITMQKSFTNCRRTVSWNVTLLVALVLFINGGAPPSPSWNILRYLWEGEVYPAKYGSNRYLWWRRNQHYSHIKTLRLKYKPIILLVLLNGCETWSLTLREELEANVSVLLTDSAVPF